MSKKRSKVETHKPSKQEESGGISEEALDFLIRAMLTPEMIFGLLQNKGFVKEVLGETRKAKEDKEDIKGLSEKYSVKTKSVEQSLEEVEEMFIKILGQDSVDL